MKHSPALASLSVDLCNDDSPLTIVTDCSARGYDFSEIFQLTGFLNVSAFGVERLSDVVVGITDEPQDSSHQHPEVVCQVVRGWNVPKKYQTP